MKRFFFILLLVGSARAAAQAGQDWTQRAAIKRPSVNLAFRARYRPSDGLHFKIVSADSNKSVVVSLNRKKGDIRFDPKKAFSPAIIRASQFNLAAMPTKESANLEVTLKLRPEFWAVYVQDRPVGFFPPAFLSPAALLVPPSELPAEEQRGVRRQKIAAFYFEDNFLVPEDQEEKLAQWEMTSGSWRLHTVKDSTAMRKGKMQAERSPNFYSLLGKGSNALITAGHPFYDSYVLETAVQVTPGEMGLVFYRQDSGRHHAFTIRMEEDSNQVLLSLWRGSTGDEQVREVISAVSAEVNEGQWIKLGIRTFQNRVQCYVDNTTVIDVPVELPPGGTFGLYAISEEGVRFDDVIARSNRDLDFRSVSDLRRHVLIEDGKFFPSRSFLRLFPASDAAESLRPPKSRKPQTLIVGSVMDGPHTFSAEFEPGQNQYCVGLLSGYTGADEPVLRFTCQRLRTNEVFALEEVSAGSVTILERTEIPLSTTMAARKGKDATVRLMSDTTNGQELRLYRDDELVLVHHLAAAQKGASGLYVAPRTKVKIAKTLYRFERTDLYRNQFEKNRAYIEDPFMRHWSSPEGQWISGTNGVMWYKGDFFGRFVARMPFVEGSEIHLGVDEEGDPVLVVRAGPTNIVLEGKANKAGQKQVLGSATVGELKTIERGDGKKKRLEKWYAIHYEDYWLWLTSGGEVLLKHRLPTPLAGSLMRLAGFTTEQLKHSHIDRFNVKDYLFTESLHEWMVNGGRWETVNRFNCDTRWSHMNGESAKTVAALWTKYRFEGDFCMELYAGMRHGWYERCGDLNVTLLNNETTPSQGYTITCTGWDRDHSQRLTKLYRNGEVIDQSDKYLVPRSRDGNKRRGYNPLVKGGRDVHGAWYYIKFRRIGKKLEYYFDNELVFSRTDDDPLPSGSAGIWTFMNSMMVARVKIAAEGIEPKQFVFTPVDPASVQTVAASPIERSKKYASVLKDGRPVEMCMPSNWEADDDVGELRLSWHEEQGVGPYFATESVLGSGSMFVKSKLPPVKYPEIAGWRFFVKRTPNAKFNFHYSVGRLRDDGKFKASHSFFQKMSGTDFSKGLFKMTGQTEVPALENAGADWHARGEWIPVEVWISQDVSRAYSRDELYVKAEGFGNLQASYVAQGLTGNNPGEGYAVRDFSEIRHGAPELSLSTNGLSPKSLTLRDESPGKTLVSSDDISELQGWIDSVEGKSLVRTYLQSGAKNGGSQNQLCWVQLPEKPDITCSWSKEYPSAIDLRSAAPYPDPDLAVARIRIGKLAVREVQREPGRLLVLVPRLKEFKEAQTSHVPVTVTANGKTNTYSLAWKDAPLDEPPVLLKVEGVTPLFHNHEKRWQRTRGQDSLLRVLRHHDAERGTYLEVGNRGRLRRLKTPLSGNFELSHYPVFQFRYRGGVMSRVTASFGGKRYVKLSEPYSSAKKVSVGDDLILDGKWHVWLGFPSDAVAKSQYSSTFFHVSNPSIGSFATHDQTGLFSTMDLDDIVVGPVVSKRVQLAVTPHYFDFGGVDAVFVAVRSGSDVYEALSEKQCSVLAWQKAANAELTVPNIEGLADGLCQMFIKALDKDGNESRVTGIPFLLDTKPLEASYSFKDTTDALSNGSKLNLRFRSRGGAPLDIGQLKIKWHETEVAVAPDRSTISHSRDQDSLALEWPYIFREQLNNTTNGQVGRIVISGIRDGAGNRSEDLVASLVIDYDKDKTPPTLLPVEFPDNVLWASAWEAETSGDIRFKPSRGTVARLVQKIGDEPYLSMRTGKDYSDIWVEIEKWRVKEHPYLTFRIRRPVINRTDGKEIGISVVMKTGSRDGMYVLPLTVGKEKNEKKERGDSRLALPRPIEWKSNRWHTVSLDLREIFGKELPSWKSKMLKVKSFGFRLHDPTHKAYVHLQSVFVSGPWDEDDEVTLNAYDASGVKASSWRKPIEIVPKVETVETNVSEVVTGTNELGDVSATNVLVETVEIGEVTVDPDPLWEDKSEEGWIIGRIGDRAGNLSAPVRLPYREDKGDKASQQKQEDPDALKELAGQSPKETTKAEAADDGVVEEKAQ